MNQINIDKSYTFFPQDADIDFIAEGHRYIYKGVEEFISVSTLYSRFFKQFDALAVARSKARYSSKTAEEFIEEWEYTRDKASSVGTFMHKQIESIINGWPVELALNYDFIGQFMEKHETIGIEREIAYFNSFRKTLQAVPFRTEWCVFDPEYKVAGTIDLICKNADGTYEMYDWKRSQKIDPAAKGYNGCKGLNGLESVDDTPYWHYVLQQNTYCYILERNYGVRVNGMHLVVLHPDYSGYKVFDVGHRPDLVETMLKRYKG
ncbi:MAG: hypothetical protein MJY59_03550 [Bacteroidaceae bacterium]|nr:hypothetical protein [Bacteroidaceae bacterium]